MARWPSSSVEVRGLVIYDIKEVEREKKAESAGRYKRWSEWRSRRSHKKRSTHAWDTTMTKGWTTNTHMFTKCFKSLHKWLGFAQYFVTSISIVLAVTLSHFWLFRVFFVEIQNAKTGLLRCSLYTPRRLQQTAVICKRCNCNKKRTIKTNSWKLFVRGFIQRQNKTGFTVLPYRFACILIYRHSQLLWTLPRTTPLPPTGRKNSMIDASADTSWMEWVWIVVLPNLGVDGLMYTTLRWSHNDFSISRKKRSSIPSKMLLDASVFQIMDQIIFFLFRSFPKTGTMKSYLLNHVVWNWENCPMFFGWRLGSLHFLSRGARMYNQTMPSLQYEKHSLHCVLGSVSNNPSSSTLPMSWITFLDVVLNWLQASFCCGSCWRDCRWGRFWIFLTSSRTRQLSTCFTTECGNPRILKSMSFSFTIDCSWFCVHELHGKQRVSPFYHGFFHLPHWSSCEALKAN